MSQQPATVELEERVDGYRRRSGGAELRRAMADQDLTIGRLADLTAELDPEDTGVNWRTIGFLVSEGRSGRETCSIRTAQLVAGALRVPVDQLFEARTSHVLRVAGISAHSRIEVHTT